MDFGRAYTADTVVAWVTFAIVVVSIVVEGSAFVHCATRRADAFPVVGRLSKAVWMLITGAAFAFTMLTGASYAAFGGGFLTTIIAFVGLACSLVYLLDLRPALRDVTEGRGNW